MAVIRAARLCLKTLPYLTQEDIDNAPEQLANAPGQLARAAPGQLARAAQPRAGEQIAYAVPWGYKAIIRTATLVCEGVPPTGQSIYAHWKVWPQGAPGPIPFHFAWLVDPTKSPIQWPLTDTWNGQMVLNEGENLMVYNGARTTLNVSASGHLLPIPTAL